MGWHSKATGRGVCVWRAGPTRLGYSYAVTDVPGLKMHWRLTAWKYSRWQDSRNFKTREAAIHAGLREAKADQEGIA